MTSSRPLAIQLRTVGRLTPSSPATSGTVNAGASVQTVRLACLSTRCATATSPLDRASLARVIASSSVTKLATTCRCSLLVTAGNDSRLFPKQARKRRMLDRPPVACAQGAASAVSERKVSDDTHEQTCRAGGEGRRARARPRSLPGRAGNASEGALGEAPGGRWTDESRSAAEHQRSSRPAWTVSAKTSTAARGTSATDTYGHSTRSTSGCGS